MASGLPVAAFLHVASDAHQMISDAQCGVSAHSGNVQECVRVMKELLSRESEFKKLGQAGQSYAVQHFSKEVCVSQLENMLL